MIDSKFFAGLTATVAFTGIITTASIANANTNYSTKTYTDTYGLETTDIENALLEIKQFDGSLGTLQNVTITFDGRIVGEGEIESVDAQAQTIIYTLSGNLQLDGPDFLDNPLFDQDVSVSNSFDATAYDGSRDYAGTSGLRFAGLTARAEGENSYYDQLTLDNFTGDGDLEFLFSASTESSVTGAANISSFIFTQAGATVSVTYEYDDLGGGVLSETERVPEPSTLLALGLFGGAAFFSKRKATNKA